MIVCTKCGHEGAASARFCEACGAALDARSSERRKVVSVLFCDVVGSTELGESTDPEVLRALLARYFDQMRAIVVGHGGSVEKFIGDAVVAVFGVPSVHEDDALRACRTAVEMQAAFIGLGVQGRIGVSTGEVVTGTLERLATGDALNVASRLQSAAGPGDVLIDETTRALVGDAVDVAAVEHLVLKGKREPVGTYRLLAARAAAERPHDSAFVGREGELATLREAWERALEERRCALVTIIGDAGLGKSRLAAEALSLIGAKVVRGRCPPYGAGITYWPVVEVVKQLGTLPSDDSAAAAIRSLLGEPGPGTSPEDIAWAFRKLLEEHGPLVVLIDDLQWGEETFLDLIEHVALLSSGTPLLLLCMARPELLDSRPSWPVSVRLAPLAPVDASRLVSESMPDDVRTRIIEAAAGNPLFIHEMLAMTGEDGVEIVVPPSLKSLLAARLDQLDPGERGVLERAAIEGEHFHRGAVQALGPDEPQLTPRLAALVRRELIRPDKAQFAGEDGFRFRHLLIRDAAYDALPKAARAEMHQKLGAWLERHGEELVEVEELVGYHLERAVHYNRELAREDLALATEARRRLLRGGQRAALRRDYRAAAGLLERAAVLTPSGEFDLVLETELFDALVWVARGHDALSRADALTEAAAVAGDRVVELCGMIYGGIVGLDLEPERSLESLSALVAEAIPVFEEGGDELALYVAHIGLATVAERGARMDAGLEAREQAYVHAERAGFVPSDVLAARAAGRYFGQTPLKELLEWLDENEPRAPDDQFLRAYRAGTLGMLGRFDEARAILGAMRAELAKRGPSVLLANILAFESVSVELWAGDAAAAAAFGAEGWRLYEEMGERSFLPGAAAGLAQAFFRLDQFDEADGWAQRAAELGSTDDAWKEMLWRGVKAKVLARRGDHAEAETLARRAVAIGETTELLDAQGDAHADLAEVLSFGRRVPEAVAALEDAIARYVRKGNVASTLRARARLAELQAVAPQ